jgi:hypothetical protein
MGNAAEWEDGHERLYFGGTMPDEYRDDPSPPAQADDDEMPIGYEAAQPALRAGVTAD